MSAAIQIILYFAVLVVFGHPARSVHGPCHGRREHTFLSPVLAPVERGVYRLLRIDSHEQMGWKRYLVSVLVFSGIGSWCSSRSRCSRPSCGQPAAPAQRALGPVVQHGGLLHHQYQLAVRIPARPPGALPCAVDGSHRAELRFRRHRYRGHVRTNRGFRQVKEQGLGSFWVDLTRTVLYVLIPLNLVLGKVCLAAGGDDLQLPAGSEG